MVFNRQLYKQKPQAWGPVSSVQASIFKNAEKIGIDPVFIYCPMSEDNYNTDYISSMRSSYDNAIFEKDKYGVALYLSVYLADGRPTITWDNTIYNYAKTITGTFVFCLKVIDFYDITSKYVCFNSTGTTGFKITIIPQSGLTSFKVGLTFFGVSDYVFNTIFLNAINTYNIFAIVINSGNIELYKNGVFVESKSVGEYKQTTNTYFKIGNKTTSNIGGYLPFLFGFKNTISRNTVAYLSDNPYYLLHRVAPVFYSVPGGGVPPTFNPLFLNAAQPTRVIQ